MAAWRKNATTTSPTETGASSRETVSYRAIRPCRGEVDNLLVPTCLSASHAAYGPVRMEPVFMMLGQAAGTAARPSVDAHSSVQELDYALLRDRLVADGAIVTWNAASPAAIPSSTEP